ncbi:MAG: long-chain fatty acid--CoA ligase [Pyrinomonas methylaliphatogenes]|jgi:long-chain acyl-CoA synthetase|nr:long-chain fatty acid--CoA ligase [Pyrinomonas methylaliphatogenes]
MSSLMQSKIAQPVRTPLSPDEPATLVEVFERAARNVRKPDMLNYKRDGRWHAISTDEFIARAHRVAAGLRSLGIRRGDRVALLSENRPEWTITDAGCQFAGATDVPIYPTQAPAQVRYILDDAQARALFIQHRASFARIAEQVRACPTLERVIFFDPEGAREAGAMTLAELEERGRALLEERPHLVEESARAVRPDDLATLIYTSGTTGEPKGVMLTHMNLVSNLLDSCVELRLNERDVALSVLPLSHVFERLLMYVYVHFGVSVYYAESIEKLAENMREVRPTVMAAVPRLFEKMYARIRERAAAGGPIKAKLLDWAIEVGKEWAKRTLGGERVPFALALQHRLASRLVFSKWKEAVGGRLRYFVSGGAALPAELGYIFTGAGLTILQGYGLTETSPVISVCTLSANRMGTVGRPIRNVEVRIAADGEIEVRGPNVMRGYYNKPEETRAAFTEDGWFRTGDVGMLDRDGFLIITDRKKELFKTSGGKYIAPQPIEQKLKESPLVSQAVLVGDGRRFPAALIVPDWQKLRSFAAEKGMAVDQKTDEELAHDPRIVALVQREVDRLMQDFSQYERVKRIALLARELSIEGGELTPTLKIKRRVIDEKYRDVIERIYAEDGAHQTGGETTCSAP